ncbi:MAG: hypothetical protein ACTSW1_10025 [Candidatus Hodarchaeales archaeon]
MNLDKWSRSFIVVMSFYIFDFFSTLFFCKSPDDEGGLSAHFFMRFTNSVLYGLILNIVFVALLWGLYFFYFAPHLIASLPKQVTIFTPLLFIMVGFFPALDFAAATSWYWKIDTTIRALIGLSLYLASLLWIKPSS